MDGRIEYGRLFFLALALLACMVCGTTAARASDYAVGADLSFLPQAEAQGAVFKDNGQAKPGMEIFRDHGYNWVRLRLFRAPTRLPNSLSYTIAAAQQAKKRGFKFLLDLHYADTWADGGHQPTPQAWAGLTHVQLTDAVFQYTRDTIRAFAAAGVLPDMVQVGNEVGAGMLWPDGKLPQNWGHFADLLRAGIRGVDAGRGTGTRPRIMIHIDKGGNKAATRWFFDKLNSYRVPYDVIGQSYYPWWHGTLLDLRDNLDFMATTYHKDIIVVETAYNWEPGNYINKPAPFPETPEGQRAFLAAVNQIVMDTPEGRGMGVFWWEPAVSAQAGGPGILGRGMFDENGNGLPVLTVFDSLTRK